MGIETRFFLVIDALLPISGTRFARNGRSILSLQDKLFDFPCIAVCTLL
jgi:hypothetical protein